MDELSAFNTRSPATSRPIVRFRVGDEYVSLLKDPLGLVWRLTVYTNNSRNFSVDSLSDSVGKILWLPGTQFNLHPGIYRADLSNAEDTTPTWLEVRGDARRDQPVTPASIWLAMLDAVPADNVLLDDYEFGDEEIAEAITAVIDLWNATPPDGIGVFSAATFPWRYEHIQAACGILLAQKSILLLRNSVEYSGAGLSVSDSAKYKDYAAIGQAKIEEFKAWAKKKKHELNLRSFFGHIGGYYA